VVVNAIKAVGLLVDAGAAPPAAVTAALEPLRADAIADVRAAAAALFLKLDRLSARSP
jgi:predicted component of type VI protein secretion system